ncbi:MAG: PIN domain-containing protein [Aquihabitans sp.]
MNGVTYDAGALIAAERNDRRMWALHAGYLALEVRPTVPVAVLAQVWRDAATQVPLARLLRGCDVEAMDEPTARRAGQLLRASGTSDVIDAVVVDGALRRDDALVTSDRRDIEALATAGLGRLEIVEL